MKGYRKLRVGEVIKDGDGFFMNDQFEAYASVCFGHKILRDDPTSHRPLPKKARKVKKFNLRNRLDVMLPDNIMQDRIDELVRFIRRNYRRKE
jgi:hypothetical protein